ncbi:1,6-anhydro-N-acetylmuramyl-L-alanine amidase AmpD [Aliidiomarina sanyensis]|uniref:1,6-anhydro-N-acetylmuramyl-L-alanine amidase AmpD n=1 Tax=Aliidiomarina sanyensis TaxID=1249555 RepID=A0A432WIN2_9GAMM|nr:1,6-anhydro-N-acetylmuramyl-L-alanine amidase AmpD [Aliidiomarina sanyensis]RUO33567.1 1,6-anhydro-N-acetylmuramyl-L-alanine amidase AmpD [Aliidiomarina sanyensis]
MRIIQHRCEGVSFYPSPHADERPSGEAVRLLVVHNISLPPGEFGTPYVTDLFLGTLDCDAHPYFEQLRELRVSAHAFIRRTGEIIQYVDFNRRAWHAGVSEWQGQSRCNDFAIGIELEGTDHTPYTKEQYHTLAALTVALQSAYPAITADHIVGHEDIAPGRKTDPGPAFDWEYYRQQIAALTEKDGK